MPTLVSFGEILFDIFGEEKHLGGAPFNFTAHFARLGGKCAIISAVGDDQNGRIALESMKKYGISNKYLAILEDKPTGCCKVTLDNGKPTYNLVSDVAYDCIPAPRSLVSADAFYFGTLAERSPASRRTLETLLLNGRFSTVFYDVNIRQDYYSVDRIYSRIPFCSILKISREEATVFGSGRPETLCVSLAEQFPNLGEIVITLDKDGSLVYITSEKRFVYSKKPKNKVRSTVGAGDSFSACYLYNRLCGTSTEIAVDRATDLSDYIVTIEGAIE